MTPRLQSIKYKNHVIYLNGDPFFNWPFPLINGWTWKDFARQIELACVNYSISYTTHIVDPLAKKICKKIAEGGGL